MGFLVRYEHYASQQEGSGNRVNCVYNVVEALLMATMKDLSIQELRSLVGDVIEEKLLELLGDPDEGLSLRPEVRERLLESLRQPKEFRKTIPAEDVARRLGVDW